MDTYYHVMYWLNGLGITAVIVLAIITPHTEHGKREAREEQAKRDAKFTGMTIIRNLPTGDGRIAKERQ